MEFIKESKKLILKHLIYKYIKSICLIQKIAKIIDLKEQ